MLRVLSIVIFLSVLITCSRAKAQRFLTQQISHPQANQPVELSLGKVTPLRAVLQIAAQYKIPLGIVFGMRPILCDEARPMNIRAGSLSDALSQAIAGTGYTVTGYVDAYVLLAPDITEHERLILSHRFNKFSATDSTMNDAGQLLSGYIKTSLGGEQGFVTSSHIGPLSKTFTLRMQDASTTEIANRIVSQNGKGIWMLRPAPSATSKSASASVVEILAYSEDLAELSQVSCGADPNRFK